LMAATADPGAVGEFAFGAVLRGIDLHIPGQRPKRVWYLAGLVLAITW
jgi:hypothetical protein